jgi:hypothetical protein
LGSTASPSLTPCTAAARPSSLVCFSGVALRRHRRTAESPRNRVIAKTDRTVVVIIARARRSLADGLRSCRPHCTACTRRYALDHSARRNLPPGKSWVVRNLDKLDLVAYREKRLGRDKVPCSCARNDGTGSRGRGRNRLHEMHHRALRMFADRAFEGAQIVARCMGLNVCQHHCRSALRARWARDRPRRRMG